MFCKHCGKEISDDSKFCQFCGTDQKFIDFAKERIKELSKPNEIIIDPSDPATDHAENNTVLNHTEGSRINSAYSALYVVFSFCIGLFGALNRGKNEFIDWEARPFGFQIGFLIPFIFIIWGIPMLTVYLFRKKWDWEVKYMILIVATIALALLFNYVFVIP